MNHRHTLTAASLAFAALMPLAFAQAAQPGTVIVQTDRGYTPTQTYQVIPAPPPPRREAVPRPRRGQVWEEGHWEWRGNRYQWVRGHWVQARAGHQYRQPHWAERDGRWEFQRGGWDRDGDGVSNRHDRDRDGDGVSNRRDQQPDNPRRN
ncbi:hypothetical protein ASF11_14035 [Acidovorax sp. Leaf76]|uniref:YXWGXW repeat-containing protein n=1 Tax=unclassified Acidovorax TaxID=2684926 RepID=UPI0006FD919C|nr:MULTISPECIES: YXWGXW repeat-containing protein [unclassified Acidovorax]KQO13950.1 hypothetical protein ASF11_14035 [Acidovorax sp. Leaf76]KQO31471.1 hypothetical protein ASF19_11730 [Acidovorax sp. Leaf84]KQS27491.1 hypothetical protein ASG27_15865 [Acidovorax sp. Leaf191]